MGYSFPYRSFPALGEDLEQTYNKIVLCLPQNMAYRVYDEFDKTQIQQRKNGDLIISVNMPEDKWLVGFLLSFGAEMGIIEPISLKKVITENAKKIYKKNKS